MPDGRAAQGGPPLPPCCPRPYNAKYWSEYFGDPQQSAHYNATTGVATIDAGSIVYLDQTPIAGFKISLLIVEGSLVFDHCNTGTELPASSILIQGAGVIQIGKSTLEFPHEATIRLIDWPTTGVPFADIAAASLGDMHIEHALLDRGLVVVNGGTLRLYGKDRGVAWTHLDGTAAAQAFSITMADPPLELESTDEIVIASTDFDQNQAEERSISSVTGNQAGFLDLLVYQHYGVVQNFDPVASSSAWDVDERAEVGLLNRNVKIEGERNPNSLSPEDYGHVFFYRNDDPNTVPPRIEISWVEFKNLGILGAEARYPVHFHEIGDLDPAPTLFIKHSSVRNSRNRGIVVHGTSDVQIENNVVYDVVGHGIYLEDDEVKDCTVLNNLSLLNSILTNQLPSVLVDRTPGNITLRSLNNNVQGNAAAESAAYGIYLELYNGSGSPAGMTFAGNSAHSCQKIGIFQDAAILPSAPITFTNNRVWKCREHGMWIRSLGDYTVSGLVAADCRSGFYPASKGLRAAGDGHQILQDSLFVGETDNLGLPTFAWETVRSLPQDDDYLFQNEPNAHTLKWDTLNGVEVYDGFVEIQNCRFAGFEDLDLTTVGQGHGYRWAAAITQVAKQSTWINDPRNVVRNLEWGNDVDRKIYFRPPPVGDNQIAFTTLVDETDCFGHGANVLYMPNTPFLSSFQTSVTFESGTGTAGLNGYFVPLANASYGQLAVRLNRALVNWLDTTYWRRVDNPGGTPSEGAIWQCASVPTESNEGGSGLFVFPVTVEVEHPSVAKPFYRMTYDSGHSSGFPSDLSIMYRFAPAAGRSVFLEISYDSGLDVGGSPRFVRFWDEDLNPQLFLRVADLGALLTTGERFAFTHYAKLSGEKVLILKMTSIELTDHPLQWDGTETRVEVEQ